MIRKDRKGKVGRKKKSSNNNREEKKVTKKERGRVCAREIISGQKENEEAVADVVRTKKEVRSLITSLFLSLPVHVPLRLIACVSAAHTLKKATPLLFLFFRLFCSQKLCFKEQVRGKKL